MSDVEYVLQLTEVTEYLTYPSHILYKLLLQRLLPERWQVVMFLFHLFKCVKVIVGAHQFDEWLHGFGVNGDHLNVARFYVFDVEFVKVLQELHQLLLPGGVGVGRERHVHHVRLHVLVDVVDRLLTVPNLHLGAVGDLVRLAVYRDLLHFCKEHSTDVLLFIH